MSGAGHGAWPSLRRNASHFSSLEPSTMEGFNNPGLHVRWQAKRAHKGAKAVSLHRVPPGSPLSVNPKVSGGDPHGGQETGTPGPLEFVLGVRAIADDHRFLGVLHDGLLKSFEHIPVAIPEIVPK
eukprot:1517710-Amphidinium_carterae.1